MRWEHVINKKSLNLFLLWILFEYTIDLTFDWPLNVSLISIHQQMDIEFFQGKHSQRGEFLKRQFRFNYALTFECLALFGYINRWTLNPPMMNFLERENSPKVNSIKVSVSLWMSNSFWYINGLTLNPRMVNFLEGENSPNVDLI